MSQLGLCTAEKYDSGALSSICSSKPVFGPGSSIASLLGTAKRVARSNVNVLIFGDTGTGKEVFAKYIHERSPRSRGKFVAVNCCAIPETLLESELFGHVRGAFTGANHSRKGRVAHADGGTFFLDEVSELPMALQVKLLRLLQERSYEPVGSSESVKVNFRLIAATNRDLMEMVDRGDFRRDLYYRLFVCPIEIPGLADRRMDITPLFMHFWNKIGEKRKVSSEVFSRLRLYSWPGNVRELEHLAQRLSVCSNEPVIEITDLPEPYLSGNNKNQIRIINSSETNKTLSLKESSPVMNKKDYCTGGDAGDYPEENTNPYRELFPEKNYQDLESGNATRLSDGEDHSDCCNDKLDNFIEKETVKSGNKTAGESATVKSAESEPDILSLPFNLVEHLRKIENRYIDLALEKTGGNRKVAAELLGLRRTTLVEKIRRRKEQEEKESCGQ